MSREETEDDFFTKLFTDIIMQNVVLRLTFTLKDGTAFTVYTKSAKDAEQMIKFTEALFDGMIKRAKTKLLEEGWTKK